MSAEEIYGIYRKRLDGLGIHVCPWAVLSTPRKLVWRDLADAVETYADSTIVDYIAGCTA